MSGTWYALPDETMEDSWFTPERLWRTAWIGRFALRSNNCVALTAQLSKSLRTLADEWKCTIKVVRNTLEGLEKRGMIRVSFGKVKGKVQTVITCLFSRFYSDEPDEKGTQRARKGHAKGTSTKKEILESEKEDSCQSQAPDEDWVDPFEPAPEAAPPAQAGAAGGGEEKTAPSSAPPPKSKPRYPAEYEALWKAFPDTARRGSKRAPFDVWKKLSAVERDQAMAGAVLWAERSRGADPKFVPMVQTWMNQRRWETEIDRPKPKMNGNVFYTEKGEAGAWIYS